MSDIADRVLPDCPRNNRLPNVHRQVACTAASTSHTAIIRGHHFDRSESILPSAGSPSHRQSDRAVLPIFRNEADYLLAHRRSLNPVDMPLPMGICLLSAVRISSDLYMTHNKTEPEPVLVDILPDIWKMV